MNKERIAQNLGVKSIEEYIISEYKKGKEDAKLLTENSLLKIKEELDKIDSDENKIIHILSNIIQLKKIVEASHSNDFYQLTKGAEEFAENNFINISNEEEKLSNLARYTVDFYNFQNPWSAEGKLKKIQESSKELHLIPELHLIFDNYFDTLNTICKIDSLPWNLSNFEKGLIEVLKKYGLEKISYQSDHEREIDLLIGTNNIEINSLKKNILNLEQEIARQKEEIEFIHSHYNKYYSNTQTIITNTYFGDNQPFLFNLFNFLKRNNLLQYGWSYFYSCLTEGNHEIIFLETTKNRKFIGRVFYHLKDLLVLHYKDESENFFHSKFYVNGEHLSTHFFANHVYKKADKDLHPFIAEIDDFFDQQKKIYLKS